MSSSVVLTSGNIILRPPQLSDTEPSLDAIRESLPELLPWMPWVFADYSRKDARDWIKRASEDWKDGLTREFVIIDARDRDFIGACGLNRIDNENRMANLGYWVRTSQAGRGVAAKAARQVSEFGFSKLSLTRIEILVDIDNLRSQRVAAKVGARREGVLRNRIVVRGSVHDCVLFSLVPDDFKKEGL